MTHLLLNKTPNSVSSEPGAAQSGEQIVRSDTILSKDSKYRGAEQVMIKKLMGCPGLLKLSEDRTSFIFDPEKAEIVRKIFEASISGRGGYTLAKQLDSKKDPAFRPSSKCDLSPIRH